LAALRVAGFIRVGAGPVALAASPDRTRLFVSNQAEQTISVIDIAAGLTVDTFPVTGDPIPLRASADGSALFVATDAHRLYRLDAASGTVMDTLDLPSTCFFIEFNAAHERLYVATRVEGTVIEIDPTAMAVLRTFVVGGFTLGLVVTADDRELWVGGGRGLEVWSLGSGIGLGDVPTGTLSGVFGLTSGTGDTHVYATMPADGKVLVVHRAQRAVLRTLLTGGIPRQVAFDAATGYVVVANESGWVDILR
jgi:DNA-binding beta-propeller fold protein YncE